jgi:hypothetical protein
MFNRRTLFVVGAGASHEAGLPLGAELAQNIRDMLRRVDTDSSSYIHDREFFYHFVKGGNQHSPEDYRRAAKTIYDGILLSKSIDDFLHIHKDDGPVVELGKAAIVRAILQSEANSDLMVDRSNFNNIVDYDKLIKTWYVKFARVLGAPGHKPHDPAKALEDAAFIVFNYDRCIEQFLRYAIRHLFALASKDAASIVDSATIIHPYGWVGALDELPFGGEKNHTYNFTHLAKRIKTYSEQLTEKDTVAAMRREVSNAESIVFLGFAFHRQNMSLLGERIKVQNRQIFGTTCGMSDSDTADVQSVLGDLFPEPKIEGDYPVAFTLNDHIQLEKNLTCSQLFDYYQRSIAG